MVTGTKNAAAQFIYLAQLEAQKGTCKCKGCQLLRKCNDAMVDQALKAPAPQAGETGAAALDMIGGDQGGQSEGEV